MINENKTKSVFKRLFKPAVITLFSLYLLILMWELFLGKYRCYGLVRNYNLTPFKTIMMYITNYEHYNLDSLVINLLGNIVAFAPLGFFIPIIFKRINKLSSTLLITILTSTLAEIIQFIFQVGALDINDVILNTLGGIIGFIIYKLVIKLSISAKLRTM